ncbi:peptide chain release factor N(5)-glutamine methyltransferase [Rubellimicrobium sp. CFH 75288]|uniref:peptide chain release factor N(5)-glutamine methyltransferase n=1 Tax=Rubellimicrobium sp. CFH 75288 TaxID=2697034 RepID=UPI0014120B8B|nr:peptide chain release factor N(5)-glutamine methyltransferase [Rubellimicrobium sp. CFH 75288]NAZ35415.1 peptide chain release factor N(5)-glutamine methyltransferase [Rubellimicrobium sp. CFH 75288]
MTDGAALLAEGAARLRAAGVDSAAGDARRLLAAALGVEPGRLTLRLADPVDAVAASAFAALLDRRTRRQPMGQILGERLFWGRPFRVTPDVLDPRPETETLVAAALEAPFVRLADLGTGSGCLLVTLLAERPATTGLGTDLSEAALEVARGNADRHGVRVRATFRRADWWEGVEGPFDLVVSNPPYIPAADLPALAPEVREWEPTLALTDGGDGLGAYRAILAGAAGRLAPGGRLLLEIGSGQAEAVAALARRAGLRDEGVRRDLDGRARVCLFRRA